MIVCIMTFILLAVLLSGFKIAPEMLIIFLCMGGMGVFIIIFCYNYFKEQNKIMETIRFVLTVMRKGNCIGYFMK